MQEKMTTDEMTERFEVHGFCAPFVVVTRKADGVKGTLQFEHMPRFYFDFIPDNPVEATVR
jgi:hypothetical protein